VGGMTGLPESSNVATLIGISDAVDVSLGATNGCAVLKSGVIQCWGTEQFRDPGGSGVAILAPTPLAMPDAIDDIIDVEVGTYHACVRRRSGQVLCMGNDKVGQLADGAAAGDTTPQPWSSMYGYP